MKKFHRNNTVTIYSNYRSINGYTLFYMVDIEHNLISPIQRSHTTVFNMYHSYEQKVVKNFSTVKKLHDEATNVYKLVSEKNF